MTEPATTAKLEARLKRRAESLGSAGLLSKERADALRSSMALEARTEARGLRLRQAGFSFLGAAAALLLMLIVPAPSLKFGVAEGSVAFLDPSGRVLQNAGGPRSFSPEASAQHAQFVVEVVAEEACSVAVRINSHGTWDNPLGSRGVQLVAGEEWLEAFPWPRSLGSVLLILSERPIPADSIDAKLSLVGSAGLAQALGCRVVPWNLRSDPQQAGEQ